MIKEYGVKNIKAKELLALDLNICKTMGNCFWFICLLDHFILACSRLVYGLLVTLEYTEEPLEVSYNVVDPKEENVIFSSQVCLFYTPQKKKIGRLCL